jgi:uncharacterized lipoprotein
MKNILFIFLIILITAGCTREDEGSQQEHDYPHPTEDFPSPKRELPQIED